MLNICMHGSQHCITFLRNRKRIGRSFLSHICHRHLHQGELAMSLSVPDALLSEGFTYLVVFVSPIPLFYFIVGVSHLFFVVATIFTLTCTVIHSHIGKYVDPYTYVSPSTDLVFLFRNKCAGSITCL